LKIAFSKTSLARSNATSVTASSEDPNYPASNLIVGQVSKKWRSVAAAAPIATQTLTIVVPAGVNNCLGIFGTNATSIAYAIKNTAESTTYFSGTLDTTPASPSRTYNRAWLEWANNGFALHIILTMTAPTTATYHECGEIVVCETITIPDPKYGLKQGAQNYQVIQRLAGGGRYVHDGAIARTFDLTWIMDRETEFDDLAEVYAAIGEKPVAMMLSDYLNNDFKWCGYFSMVSDPSANHDYPTMSIINLSIEESI